VRPGARITDEFTAICGAAQRGRGSVASFLLDFYDNGFDDWHRLYFTSVASMNIHARIVLMLLDAGATVDAPDENGRTPLYWAAQQDREDVVEMLSTFSAVVDAEASDGMTVLMVASFDADWSIVRSLPQVGAGPSANRPDGQTASVLAKRRKPVVELLDLAVRVRENYWRRRRRSKVRRRQ
jgi:ankyrin repeat protein